MCCYLLSIGFDIFQLRSTAHFCIKVKPAGNWGVAGNRVSHPRLHWQHDHSTVCFQIGRTAYRPRWTVWLTGGLRNYSSAVKQNQCETYSNRLRIELLSKVVPRFYAARVQQYAIQWRDSVRLVDIVLIGRSSMHLLFFNLLKTG